MRVLVIEGDFGGETATAGIIWNYPGVKDADGFELMMTMKTQAKEVGTKFVSGKVSKIDTTSGCFNIYIGNSPTGGEFFAKTLIFAQGSERRRLGLPNEKELTGKGVHYCVTCDGPVYVGKTVAIVGGGDASIKGVNLLGEYATKIYLIVKNNKIIAEPINEAAMKKLGDKVEIIFENQVTEIIGSSKFEKAVLAKEYKGSKELVTDALFVEIGANPDVALAGSVGVALDELGYIAVDNLMRTNVQGVFAAGDAVNHFGKFKQTITAAALGAVAVTSAYDYYKLHGNLCEVHWKPADGSDGAHPA